MKKFKVSSYNKEYIVTALQRSNVHDNLTFLGEDGCSVAQFNHWDRWCEITENGSVIEEEFRK